MGIGHEDFSNNLIFKYPLSPEQTDIGLTIVPQFDEVELWFSILESKITEILLIINDNGSGGFDEIKLLLNGTDELYYRTDNGQYAHNFVPRHEYFIITQNNIEHNFRVIELQKSLHFNTSASLKIKHYDSVSCSVYGHVIREEYKAKVITII